MPHFLLAKAIDHISVYHSFCAMHKKDVNIGRLTIEELIPENEFNDLYLERNKRSREYLMESLTIDGICMTRASYYNSLRQLSEKTRIKCSNRMKGTNNIVYKDGVVEKIRRTKIEKGLDKVCAERASHTMKKEFTDEYGNVTSIYKESAKKISRTLRKEIVDEHGNITTHAMERGKKKSAQMIRDGKWFVVKNVFNETVEMILPEVLVRKISPGLTSKTKYDYLGQSKFGQNHFKKLKKEHLIGLFVEELPKAPESYNLDQDYNPYL